MGRAEEAAAEMERADSDPGIDDPPGLLLRPPRSVQYQVLEGDLPGIPRTETAAGRTIPENANHYKYLDFTVFQYAYAVIEASEERLSVDSARAVYVPTGDEKRIWTRSWISNGAHIQVCLKNPACILGTWLHHPTELEESDAPQAQKLPRSSSSLKIQGAVKKLKAMPMAERVQLLVNAKLMSQDEADQAKRKLAEGDGAGR